MESVVIISIMLFQIVLFLNITERIGAYSRFFPKGRSNDILTKLSRKELEKKHPAFVDMHDMLRHGIDNRSWPDSFEVVEGTLERALAARESTISLMTPIPLYLGLIGTVLGIVIGLWSIPSISSNEFLEGSGVDILIGGVRIAMISSLSGLVLTTILSGWLFRQAKGRVDTGKDAYLIAMRHYISLHGIDRGQQEQSELFVHALENFNSQFTENAEKLDKLFGLVANTFSDHLKLIENVNKLNLVEFAETNSRLFSELADSGSQVRKLNEHLIGINEFTQNSLALSDRLSSMLDRTQEVEEIAISIKLLIESSAGIQDFLHGHFDAIESQGKFMRQALMKTEDGMLQAVDHLTLAMKDRLEEFKKSVILQESALVEIFEKDSTALQNLRFLKNIDSKLDQARILASLEGIHKELTSINNKSNRPDSIAKRVSRLFRRLVQS